MSGKKFDGGKERLDLLPVDAVTEVVRVIGFGAAKYGDRNWEQGMDWSRMYGAMLRHSFAFWSGEDTDPESGLPHMAHAACCALMLLAYQSRAIGADNRPLDKREAA